MEDFKKDFLYCDGMWLRKDQLLRLAMNAGSYHFAEHYLFALLFDATIKGRREALTEVNSVREHYHLESLPLSGDIEDDGKVQNCQSVTAADKESVKRFNQLTEEAKLDILHRSLKRLYDEHLFTQTRHWLAIFLVVKDRLYDKHLKQTTFLNLANKMTPADWPEGLRMDKNTSKNFGRELGKADRSVAYYTMKSSPQRELCNSFWAIIKEMILTQK